MDAATWTASGWMLIMSAAMGVGCFVICITIWRYFEGKRVPREMGAVRDELEVKYRGVINACMYLMERVRDLADFRASLPPEYQVICDQVLRFAKLMEEATYEDGANAGIFPRPMLSPTSAAPAPAPAPPVPPSSPPPNKQPEDLTMVKPTTEGLHLVREPENREWINGQLMRKAGA